MRFTYQSTLPASTQAVYDWHTRAAALPRLTPPWQRVDVLQPARIEDGARAKLRIHLLGPITVTWDARHEQVNRPTGFTDVQESGPFRSWRHEHRFEPEGDDRTRMTDRIDFQAPLGPVGRVLSGVERELPRAFAWRHQQVRLDMQRIARHADQPRLRIGVTGSHGLIGSALCSYLDVAGHEIVRFVRRDARDESEIAWDPDAGEVREPDKVARLDAVVHLGAVSINAPRWTERVKRRLVESRTVGTRAIAEAMAKADDRPRVLISASAIGYYGSRPADEIVDEHAEPGTGFLADICRQWEAATQPAEAAGHRVAHARFGVVLSEAGGALAAMLPAFRMGAGGVIGSGDQPMSVVALDDAVGAIDTLLHHPAASGPFNIVIPEPTDNRRFVRALGRVLGRPTLLPMPAAAVRTLLGEMGQTLLLEGAAVRPARLLELGFDFAYPTLEAALAYGVGRLDRLPAGAPGRASWDPA